MGKPVAFFAAAAEAPPSAKLRAGDAPSASGPAHRTVRDKLANELQGDLDWIVMKSLEKDRNRR